MAHCRNNLRQLGVRAHANFLMNYDQILEIHGREFWQLVRVYDYQGSRPGEWKKDGRRLNPFGCPVLGIQPDDFAKLDDAAFAKLMSDPSTIDYRGPSSWPEAPGRMVLGADREGNHPSGGHVLLGDFSVQKSDHASIISDDWSAAASTRE